MKLESEFFGFLGLAAKAGKCAYGTFAGEKLVKTGKAHLLLYDCALSERSKHDIENMCRYYDIPHIETEPEYQAGKACGKDGIMVIAITDGGFKDRLVELSIGGGAILG